MLFRIADEVMLRRLVTKLLALIDNREAVFLLGVLAVFVACFLFAVGFLDASRAELLIDAAGVGLILALGYLIRFLMKW